MIMHRVVLLQKPCIGLEPQAQLLVRLLPDATSCWNRTHRGTRSVVQVGSLQGFVNPVELQEGSPLPLRLSLTNAHGHPIVVKDLAPPLGSELLSIQRLRDPSFCHAPGTLYESLRSSLSSWLATQCFWVAFLISWLASPSLSLARFPGLCFALSSLWCSLSRLNRRSWVDHQLNRAAL